MLTHWLLFGGPADGQTVFTQPDVMDFDVMVGDKVRRYRGLTFKLGDCFFRVGVPDGGDPQGVNLDLLASRVRDLGLEPLSS